MGENENRLIRMNRLAAELAARLERMNARLREPRVSPLTQARSVDDELYRRRLRGR